MPRIKKSKMDKSTSNRSSEPAHFCIFYAAYKIRLLLIISPHLISYLWINEMASIVCMELQTPTWWRQKVLHCRDSFTYLSSVCWRNLKAVCTTRRDLAGCGTTFYIFVFCDIKLHRVLQNCMHSINLGALFKNEINDFIYSFLSLTVFLKKFTHYKKKKITTKTKHKKPQGN